LIFPAAERKVSSHTDKQGGYMIAVGQPAPQFSLKDQDENEVKLSDYRGKNVILAFYPLDWSPVCTNEHGCLTENLPDLQKLNAQVLGVSVDSTWSHKAFAEKLGVSYPLLADFHPRGVVSDKFGAYHPDKGITGRVVVIVDKSGKIAWCKDYGFGNVPDIAEIGQALKSLQ